MAAGSDVGVLLALRGEAEEDLVRRIATEPGLRVVRRCADVAELTAAVVAGLGTVVVLDADLGVDRTLLDRLRAHGARTLVCCGAEDVPRYDALGALALARGVDPVPAVRSLAEAEPGDETGEAVERVREVLDPARIEREAPGTGGEGLDPGGEGVDAGGAGVRGGASAPGDGAGAGEAPVSSGPPAGSVARAAHAADPHEPHAADPESPGAHVAGAAPPEQPAAGAQGRGSSVAELPATRAGRRRRELRSDGAPPAALLTPRIVAVTGPSGSPGRSTIAINLAHELAQHGEEVVLIDADLWGGAIAQTLGLLAETAGLSAAVRAADHGRLDQSTFARHAPKVADHLRVLPGLARASRWREVSAVSTLALLEVARRAATWVVVEVPVLVPDEDAGYSLGPGRNDVAHALLGEADETVVVGAAEPIGIERLVQTLLDLDDVTSSATRRVVVNRLRASAAGPRAADSVREALARFADVSDPVLVPDDRGLCDRALLAGTTWREAGGRSGARAAVTALADDLRTAAGRPAPVTDRGLARLWPLTRRRAAAH